ncbi:MAG: hypothetical protein ABI210_10310, partial [Abditibacteriaceae bacterium]
MTKRDFAAFACKLLGVFFLITSIGTVVTFIVATISSFALAFKEPFGWLGFLGIVGIFLTAAFTVGIGLLLWFKARQCAERIFPEDSLPSTLAADKNLMPIALSVTGVIVLAFTLPHFLSIIIIYLTFPKSLGQVP